jgi:hypothetical protein
MERVCRHSDETGGGFDPRVCGLGVRAGRCEERRKRGRGVRERTVRRGRGMQKGGPEEGVRSVMAQAKVVTRRTAASTSRRQDFRASKSLVRKYEVSGKNRMRLHSTAKWNYQGPVR